MNREELFNLAKKYGRQPGKKMPKQGKANLRKELVDYFNTPGGQEALGRAPSWLREKSLEEIVDLLLREVD